MEPPIVVSQVIRGDPFQISIVPNSRGFIQLHFSIFAAVNPCPH
jgi:hypothetical protein